MKDLLKNLCNLDGVAGYEDDVRKYIMHQISPYADTIETDALGNLIAFKKGEKPRNRPVLICAHMDEVGFLVTNITDEGQLHLTRVGGIDPRVLIGHRVRIGDNKIIGAVALNGFGICSDEEIKYVPDIEDLCVDIGNTSRFESEKIIDIGDPVYFDSDFIELNDDCVRAKAFDDRIGCAIMIKMIENSLLYDTYFAFSTGEEVDCKGAEVIANRIKPGVSLVLETALATDFAEINVQRQSCRLRGGPVVSVLDGGTIYNKTLRNRILEAADRQQIKWQLGKTGKGGTDSEIIHIAAGGSLAFGMGTPTRYIHCAYGILCLSDLMETLKMATLFINEVGECNDIII